MFTKKKISPKVLWILVPVTAYASARLMIWGIPKQGFMSVNIYLAPLNLGRYLLSLFIGHYPNETTPLYKWYASIFSLSLFTILLLLTKNRSLTQSKVLYISALICLLPFSVLNNHQHYYHTLWAFVLLMLSTSIFLSEVSKHYKKISYFAVILLFMWMITVSTSKKPNTILKKNKFNLVLKKLYQPINRLGPEDQVVELIINGISIMSWDAYKTASILAHKFPDRQFMVRNSESQYYLYIKDGSTYVVLDDGAIFDSFKQEVNIKIERTVTSRLTIKTFDQILNKISLQNREKVLPALP